jgi:hypothetical protein
MKDRKIIVNDGRDYFLVNYSGSDLNEAQDKFRNGELELVFRFTFLDGLRKDDVWLWQ